MSSNIGFNDSTLQALLSLSYDEATKKNGLIDFTKLVRGADGLNQGKYSLKLSDVEHLFHKLLWEEIKTKNGHRKIINKITHVVVEHTKHDKIDAGAGETILNAVQKHLNILCNEIFAYKIKCWKTLPQAETAIKNYHRWNQIKHS